MVRYILVLQFNSIKSAIKIFTKKIPSFCVTFQRLDARLTTFLSKACNNNKIDQEFEPFGIIVSAVEPHVVEMDFII